MERKRACRNCRCLFTPVRNPQQHYCRNRLCQNVRKSLWRLEKNKKDPDYRENQNQACKRWRKKNPQYWKSYRAAHPLYVESNRCQQRKRRHASTNQVVANSDALITTNPVKTGTYQLIPRLYDGFANSDAFIVELSVISRDCGQMGENCKHTTL